MTDRPYAVVDSDDPRVLLINHWQQNPHDFIVSVFSAEPDTWQENLMKEVHLHDRVAVRSGHGVGKTTALAWLIWWWLMTRHPARVACTAPTGHQLADILWSEIAKWHDRMDPALADLYEVGRDQVFLKSNPRTCRAIARTARKEQPEAFQGQHSEHMLFIVDEASGVEDIIFEVGAGAMSTAGAKVVMAGNPTRPSGYFYEAFTSMREDWHTIHISCLDARMVDPEYPKRMARQYGEDKNIYRVRVLGEFPTASDSAVISLEWVEAAVYRDVETDPEADRIWGLDVARFGDDDSALAKRWSNRLEEPVKTWSHRDIMQTVGIVMNEWEETPVAERPTAIMVDVIGMGAGVKDRLRELGLPAVGVNVAEEPAVKAAFMRLRDELWWATREWFMAKDCCIPDDGGLVGELTAPNYGFTSSGKKIVESKEELKARGVKSPNRADAVNLTMARRGRGGRRGYRKMKYSSKRVV